MPRPCSICARDDVEAVNRARFAERLSFNDIAARYALAKGTVMRHFDHAQPPAEPAEPAPSTTANPAAITVIAPPPWPEGKKKCLVCPSPHRQAIEEALASGTSPHALEKVYGISAEGIDRHTTSCIPQILERAQVRLTAGTVLDRMTRLMEEVDEFLAKAKGEENMKAWAAALQRVERSLALLAKLTGELRGTDEDALLRSPFWRRIVEAIERGLVDHPEAAAALKTELLKVGA